MKKNTALLALLLLTSFCTHAAELDDLQARIAANRLLSQASDNLPLSRPQLLALCQSVDGARWCSGYLSALITIHQVPRNCLPVTDMAPFVNGALWELTTGWLMQQAQDSTFTVYEAITGAMAQETRCPMGVRPAFELPEFIPYSEAELREIRRGLNMLPVNDVVPSYPPLAQRNGIEGWAQMSFTVTQDGTTKDIVVVDSDPPEIFDTVSLEAAKQLRYEVWRRNGVSIEIPNVQHVFRFALE